MIDDHIALLPEDVAKQAAVCQGIQSGLRAYQRELASLWVQGRELERDATERERTETLAKLEELQNVFETALRRATQRVTDLEKALTSRRYFQVDLHKTCRWLRQAETITFPEINLSNIEDNKELQTQLSNFQSILDQATENENLLLIVQRIGQEILPTLNEIDHCYLDERLNALPQLYNSILALAKEKKDRVQRILLERKEFSTFLDITRSTLETLQEQFDNLETQTISVQQEEFLCRIREYKGINERLDHISPAVRQLHCKNEGFVSLGWTFREEETQQLISLHNTLRRTINQKVHFLDDALKTVTEWNRLSPDLFQQVKCVRETLVRLQSDTETGSMDHMASLYSMLERLDCVSSQAEQCKKQIKSLGLTFDPAALQETTSELESLQSLRSDVKRCVEERESSSAKYDDVDNVLEWLRRVEDSLVRPLSISEVNVERVHEEVRKLNLLGEEVKSKLRIADAMFREETLPVHEEEKRQELTKLGAEVQQEFHKKQVSYHIRSAPSFRA